LITGRVSGRHALIPLRVDGPNSRGEAEFVLDTGFAGFLTLPADAIAKLGLPYVGVQPSSLADSSKTLLTIYRLTVHWDGEDREVDVLELPGAPLLGMSLLDGFDVRIQAIDGGLVTIERL
jgi:clan AA aspartic protease